MKLNKLLKSPKLLYFLLTLVILNIMYFLQTQNTRSLIILILIGLVTYSIKENWIIVFSVSLILTNCLFNRKLSYMEGMKEGNVTTQTDSTPEAAPEEATEVAAEAAAVQEDGTAEGGGTAEGDGTAVKEEEVKGEHAAEDSFVVDDTATLQASYENISKFLDSPGFAKLTDETHKLAKSQDKLMKSLATLTPVLNDAKASIGNLDLSTYGSLSDIIMNLGKK